MSEAMENMNAAAEAIGLTMTATFVPFSQSRNAKPADSMLASSSPQGLETKPWSSLNWRVTLHLDGRAILETDYSQGEGHAPAYKLKTDGTRYGESLKAKAIAAEIETGRVHLFGEGVMYRDGIRDTRKPIDPPPLADVLYSLASDASVLDAGGFEAWAEDLGYSTDSRKAEASYRACLEIALKLRAAIGEEGLTALREASEGY
jgi:hypothetical protein